MKTAHELIQLPQWPTMPSPWVSFDAGELWIWDEYFATLQKGPPTIELAMTATAGKPPGPVVITYPYAMTVFYRLPLNPHGPSHRPVLVVALEQATAGAAHFMSNLLRSADLDPEARKAIGMLAGNPNEPQPVVVGLFYGTTRAQHGEFVGPITADSARQRFFQVVQNVLQPDGQPRYAGAINDAFGHHQTGLPPRVAAAPLRKRRWAQLMLLAWVGTMVVCAAYAFLTFKSK